MTLGGILAILAAYAGTFNVPLLLDDEFTIIDNPSIRNPWALHDVFSPPATAGTGGRPIANLTFALSHALSRLEPWGHHAFNLAFHLLAALTLYGVVRRTLATPLLCDRFGREAVVLAGAVAVLWAIHPLQTQTVTYLSQRTEGLMALCYLLVIYCFVRGIEAHPRLWHFLAVAACLVGAMSKEIIATAPLMVLLYDRTFITGSFREALRQRWRLYGYLSISWLLLAALVVEVGDRGVGFNLGVSWFKYALTQCEALVRYVSLCVWPHPLTFDYGPILVESLGSAFPSVILAATMIAGTLWAVIRWPAWGFAAGWFFLILAPTSIVPVTGAPIAENRVYLPLAGIIALFVMGLHILRGRRTVGVACVCLVTLGITITARRNLDYQSAIKLWTDTVAKAPANHRAHNYLAKHLAGVPHRQADALRHYAAALRLRPDYPQAHNNLALLHAQSRGMQSAAIRHYETALRLKPGFAKAHYNLANLLTHIPGRQHEARMHYESALRARPDFAEAHHNLANLLVSQGGRESEARAHYETALQLKPDYPEMHYNYASLLARHADRQIDAIGHYQEAVRLRPHFAEAHHNLAQLLSALPGRQPEAIAHYEQALLHKPGYAGAHNNLANLLARLPGREAEAIAHYEAALRFAPDFAQAHYNLAQVLARIPTRRADAAAHHEAALRLRSPSARVPVNPPNRQESLSGGRG